MLTAHVAPVKPAEHAHKKAPEAGWVQMPLLAHGDDWLAREITLYLKRVLKRLDVTARSSASNSRPPNLSSRWNRFPGRMASFSSTE